MSDLFIGTMKRVSSSKPGLYFKVFQRIFSSIEVGQIQLRYRGLTQSFGNPTVDLPNAVDLQVHHPDFFKKALFGGTNGAAESYMQGQWDTRDLPGLVRIILKNRAIMDQLDNSLMNVSRPFLAIAHALKRNTIPGSKKNIVAHYDLGNLFFSKFLDSTMQYSSAYFQHPEQSLEEASIAKMESICFKLNLKTTDHVLEIGSGWGSLAIYMAKTRNCQVTTTTISEEQFQLTRKKVLEAGLENQITVLKQDYRELKGQFDKLVSVEMIEAVGHQYLDRYVETCMQRLKPEGVFLLQVITIRDHLYKAAVKSVDFIKKYIFPGSFIPSISAVMSSIAKNTDFRMVDMQDFTAHYARTIQIWRQKFLEQSQDIEQLGFPVTFLRMWDFYLSYCEGGFKEESIGCAQILFARPSAHNSLKNEMKRSI